MSVFAISDLHLSLSCDKPMEIFGGNWDNYMERLKENWEKTVCDTDYVLIPGDVSWAMYIKNAYQDFEFINSLPGTKIISKGNHDYWWETVTKLNNFAKENGFTTIKFLHNNAFSTGSVAFCGSRGYPINIDNASSLSGEEKRIYEREVSRFSLSLDMAKKLGCEKIVAMLHYMPEENSEFMNLMNEAKVDICVYGHFHGMAARYAFEGEKDGVLYKLVSCDYLDCMPYKLL